MHTPKLPHSRNGRITTGAALLAVIAMAAAILLAFTGQPATPQHAARHANTARQEFTHTYAPRRRVAATLLAPATDDWWAAVTGLAGQLRLPDGHVPGGAQWVGYSLAESTAGLTDGYSAYPAVYIGFATAAQAHAYSPGHCQCKRFDRANTVTLMSPTASYTGEPFNLSATAPTGQLKVTRGSWHVDFTELVRQLTDHSRYATQLRDHFRDLGFGGPHVTWTATSPTPQGPWTATVHSFQPEKVNVGAADMDIVETAKVDCQLHLCDTVGDGGLDTLMLYENVQDKHLSWGEPTLAHHPAPGRRPAPSHVVLAGGIDAHNWEGAITGDHTHYDGRLDKISFSVSDTDTLTVWLTLTRR